MWLDGIDADVYRSRRVLVTGASGFVGRWVARALTDLGAELWVTGRSSSKLTAVCENYDIRGRSVVADLLEPGAFMRLYRDIRPDVTFNLAGYGVDPAERDEAVAAALNAQLVGEIAEAVAGGHQADWRGLRLVHAGSAAEYGAVDGLLTEATPTSPASMYGRTKLEGTRALSAVCDRTGVRAITARAFTVYGPGEHSGRLLPSLLGAARSGVPLPLTPGEQRRDFTYVADLAEGLLRLGALTVSVPKVMNVVTGRLTSVRAFAECAAELLGLPRSQLLFGALPARPDEVEQGPADTRGLRELLGWAPCCSVADGIRQTIRFETRVGTVSH
jgi:nucleoside-diphosphate-sugar epimerase